MSVPWHQRGVGGALCQNGLEEIQVWRLRISIECKIAFALSIDQERLCMYMVHHIRSNAQQQFVTVSQQSRSASISRSSASLLFSTLCPDFQIQKRSQVVEEAELEWCRCCRRPHSPKVGSRGEFEAKRRKVLILLEMHSGTTRELAADFQMLVNLTLRSS